MDLLSIYTQYVKVNEEFMGYIFDLSGNSNLSFDDDSILEKLKSYEKAFEDMKIKADVLEVDEVNQMNLQDLKYLIMDTLFASFDLIGFCKIKEVERFRMRAANYVNKRKRAEIFNESRHSECRVGF